MKCNMPGAGSGLQCGDRIKWLGQRNFFIRTKQIHMLLICTQVCLQKKFFVRRKYSGVYMGCFLSCGVLTFSELLDDLHGWCQGTIAVDRQRSQAARAKIGYKNPSAGFVLRNITRTTALTRLCI